MEEQKVFAKQVSCEDLEKDLSEGRRASVIRVLPFNLKALIESSLLLQCQGSQELSGEGEEKE